MSLPFGKIIQIISVHISTILWLALFCFFSTPAAFSQYRFDVLNTDTGLPQNSVGSILQTRDGYLWIATLDGLVRYDGARYTVFNKANSKGILSNRFNLLYEDSDGALWVGTEDGGLNRFKDGKFTPYTTKEGMFSNGVFAILEDRRGNFWMSSNQGIHRVRKQQLNDFAEGRVAKIDAVSYGKADGMLSTECNGARQPAGVKTRDGRLWFPTFDGVAVVDPEAAVFNSEPPPVVIDRVVLDRQEMDPRQPIEVRPGKNNLEIHYTALSFIKPEHLQFKYKLEGLDKDWVDAGNRRVAYFPYPAAGSYTFRVQAANSDGVWNETGAAIQVTVIPPFYQTWWFTLLAAASVAGLAALFYRARQ
jgi:YXYXY domain-containing protein/two component regulator with propeller domain